MGRWSKVYDTPPKHTYIWFGAYVSVDMIFTILFVSPIHRGLDGELKM